MTFVERLYTHRKYTQKKHRMYTRIRIHTHTHIEARKPVLPQQ